MAWIEAVRVEMLRYYLGLAWRRYRRSSAMIVLMALTMAVGIASCMTTLTIFSALAGQPLPGVSEHLYVATADSRDSHADNTDDYKPDSYFSLYDAQAMVDAHPTAQLAAVASSFQQLSGEDEKQQAQVSGLLVHGDAFNLFGIALQAGQPWTPDDERTHAPLIAIDTTLAHGLFGTEQALGRIVHIGHGAFRVVAVYAPWRSRTKFLDVPHSSGEVLEAYQQFMLPVQTALDGGVGPTLLSECDKGTATFSYQSTTVGECRWMEVWSRLDDADAVSRYQRWFANYTDAQKNAGRYAHAPQPQIFSTRAWMALNRVVPDDVYLNLMWAAAFLLLCMTNVVGLMTAHFLRQRAESVMRRALGASRQQLFAQHLTEAGLLGLASGLLALPLIWLGLKIVRMQPVAYADVARFHLGVFAMLSLLSLAVGLVVGLFPAWHTCRMPLALQIKRH